MDGNRHWAKENNKSLEDGYRAGADALFSVLDGCIEVGVRFATIYAFSTENWRRPKEQKGLLMRLFEESFTERLGDFTKRGINLNYVGRLEDFPLPVRAVFKKSEEATKKGDNLILNVAVSYGGRAEIVDATKKIIRENLKPEEVTEERFAKYIYESGQPDPELIIRTSGEKRLSGFMLWQSSYSELYFTDKNWPDFNGKELKKALEYYKNIKRNFGK